MNQLRALVFHPYHEEILYSASVNDSIRKWNISSCSQVARNQLPYSVHSLAINPDGSFLAFGTLEGYVGQID
jgi:WD40 repeat protein